MFGNSARERLTQSYRELAAAERRKRDLYEELHAEIRRNHPETINARAWAILRASLLQVFADAQQEADKVAKLFDQLAGDSHERRHPRRPD